MLPALNILNTKSFWSQALGLAAVLAPSVGLPAFDAAATVEVIMQIVGAVGIAYGYYQRANPTRRVTLTGPVE